MTFNFRADMKVVLHDVDGDHVQITGKTIDTTSSALVAMVEVVGRTDLRLGARVRCSYVEPSGVHTFDTVIIAADPLALNHRLVRVALASPKKAERIQRREHVRVLAQFPVRVHCLVDDLFFNGDAVDISAGGMALTWPADRPPEVGEDLQVEFATDRFEHSHDGTIVGSTATPEIPVARVQFHGLSPSERDRLVVAVFAIQRQALRQKRNSAHL